MPNASTEDIQRAISQLSEGDRRDLEIEIAIGRFASDKMTVRRLIDWIPEAFGYVLLPHVGDVTLPTTFSARAKDGTWKDFSFDREPIFGETVKIASAMYRDGPRTVFFNVAKRSSMVAAANKALNDGQSLGGATMSGPAMIGIPAEFYDAKARPAATSFWKKLVG
jgi:hypothetical protein